MSCSPSAVLASTVVPACVIFFGSTVFSARLLLAASLSPGSLSAHSPDLGLFNAVLLSSRMRAGILDLNTSPLCLGKADKRNHSVPSSSYELLPSAPSAVKGTEHFKNSTNHTRPRITSRNKHDPRQRVLLQHRSPHSKATTMLLHAKNGNISEALAIWDELANSSYVPTIDLFSSMIKAYSRTGYFDEIFSILNWLDSREFNYLPQAYAVAVHCFGTTGNLDLMETTLKKMVNLSFPVDSITGNSYIMYYSLHGSLAEMEAAYDRVKRSRILIEEPAIRAVSSAYMKRRKFYNLGELIRDVGLRRRNMGNLLWNLLLLSYAVNFKMKSLQRSFLEMVEAGFQPDITTFNIRAMAFSRMDLFWDLHLSLEHMSHVNVAPDLVTYGCVVEAYLEKRMGQNLDFALSKMGNEDDRPWVSTEGYVMEVMGKGDFQMSSEAFMEFSRREDWTFRKLVGIYLKKRYRSRQVFWNY